MPAPAAITTAPPDFAQAEYHLGMVNPPRRVKRLREIALKEPSSSIAPVTSSLSPSSTSSDNTRASLPPASTAPPPRRRGRKPAGPLSKSAREQLRKTNHSVIEKRRREKINEALAALRELVPHEKQEGEKKEDKEFKLEVLVRTVEYLRVMVDKVTNLESAKCQKCGGSLQDSAKAAAASSEETSRALKRKRGAYGEESSVEEHNNKSSHPDAPPTNDPEITACHSTEPQPPRLPSISSWISMDPPPLNGPSPLTNSHAYQLPSPPHTAPFTPVTIASSGFPPRLVLPSPIAPTSPATAPARHRGPSSSCQGSPPIPEHTYSASLGPFSTRDRDVPELPLDIPTVDHTNMLVDPTPSTGTHNSTLRSPASTLHILPSETSADADARYESPQSPWSRDDQTAASLLLNISSRPRHSRAESGSGSESGSVSSSATGNETLSGSHSHSMSGEHRERSPCSPLQHLESTAGADMEGRPGARRGGAFYEAQTPRSVLGMGEGSGGGDPSTRTM